jgi:hypothetical protein
MRGVTPRRVAVSFVLGIAITITRMQLRGGVRFKKERRDGRNEGTKEGRQARATCSCAYPHARAHTHVLVRIPDDVLAAAAELDVELVVAADQRRVLELVPPVAQVPHPPPPLLPDAAMVMPAASPPEVSLLIPTTAPS